MFLSPQPFKLTAEAVAMTEKWRLQSGFSGEIICIGTPPDNACIPQTPAWTRSPRISTEKLNHLMGSAKAVIYASSKEGFGMPPVEALLAGTAPVYSRIEVTTEVMQGAGFSFINGSYDSFRSAMDAALSSSHAEITAWGNELYSRHNWPTVVSRLTSALKNY